MNPQNEKLLDTFIESFHPFDENNLNSTSDPFNENEKKNKKVIILDFKELSYRIYKDIYIMYCIWQQPSHQGRDNLRDIIKITMIDYRKSNEGIESFFFGSWFDFFESSKWKWLHVFFDITKSNYGFATELNFNTPDYIWESKYKMHVLSTKIKDAINSYDYGVCVVSRFDVYTDWNPFYGYYQLNVRMNILPLKFKVENVY